MSGVWCVCAMRCQAEAAKLARAAKLQQDAAEAAAAQVS